MRWFKEFMNPSLKCDRVGHKPGIEYRRGYTTPEQPYWHVCDKVREERVLCKRCKTPLGKWSVAERTGINSWSCPSSMAEEFDMNGEVWIDQGVA